MTFFTRSTERRCHSVANTSEARLAGSIGFRAVPNANTKITIDSLLQRIGKGRAARASAFGLPTWQGFERLPTRTS
jgi:hypothetical protein